MPDVLPATPTPEAYEALAKDDARIVAAARLVADRHRLAGAPIARFAGGSLPVFALGPSRVLKLYPPCFPGEAEVELGVLQALERKLPIPTPRVDAHGEIDGWRWILVDRLRGELLSDVWPRLGQAERHGLASLAANERGLYPIMRERLFQHPDARSTEALAVLGADLDLGGHDARASAQDAARAGLSRAAALAATLSVSGTPVFFINGRKIAGAQPIAAFEIIIEEELQHARALVASGVPRGGVYAEILEEARRHPATVEEAPSLAEPTRIVEAARSVTGAHLFGAPGAHRTLVVFGDFECPYFAKIVPRLRKLSERHRDLRVVLRHLPLPIHPHARLAARAAIAAEAQGKLEAFTGAVFANPSDLTRDALVAAARRLGLDLLRFERDLDSTETMKRLAEDEALAATLDVRGTPTSFLDGRRVDGAQSEATFESAWAAERPAR